jgi:hypothetical protein
VQKYPQENANNWTQQYKTMIIHRPITIEHFEIVDFVLCEIFVLYELYISENRNWKLCRKFKLI